MTLKSLDFYLIALAFFVATFSAKKIWIESELYYDQSQRLVMASVQEKDQIVKWKQENSLMWLNADKGILLGQGDEIYTYTDAKAKLGLNQGGEITLGSDSLIKIQKNTDSGRTQLLLEKGVIKVDTNQEDVLLQINDVKIESHKGSFKIEKKNNQVSQIKVLSGEIKIKSKDTSTNIQASSSKVFELNQNGETSERALSWKPISPEESSVLKILKRSPLEFRFKKIQPYEPKELWLSQDRTFKKKVRVAVYNKENVNIIVPRNGTWYWTLLNAKQIDESAPPEDIASFDLLIIPPPAILSPAPESITYLKDKTDNDFYQTIQFAGFHKDLKYVLKVIEIEQDSQNETFHQIDNTSEEFILKIKAPATYQLSISTNLNDRTLQTPPTTWYTKSFTLPPSPKIISPKQGEIFKTYSEKVTLEFEVYSAIQKLVYEFELENNLGEKQFIKNSQPSIKIPLEQGKYRLRVRSILHEVEGDWSESINFTIENLPNEFYDPNNPQKGAIVELSSPTDNVTLEWSQIADATGPYLFEVSNEPEFKEVIQQQFIKSNKTEFSPGKAGVFYWRAKLTDKNGKTQYAPPQKIEIRPTAPLLPPKLPDTIKLEIQQSLNESSNKYENFVSQIIDFLVPNATANDSTNSFIKLTWPAINKAKAYQLEIYPYENADTPLHTFNIQENSYIWDRPQIGKYKWRIRVQDSWNQWGPYSDFSTLDVLPPHIKEVLPSFKIESLVQKTITIEDESQTIVLPYKITPNDTLNLKVSAKLYKKQKSKRPFYSGPNEIPASILKNLQTVYIAFEAYDKNSMKNIQTTKVPVQLQIPAKNKIEEKTVELKKPVEVIQIPSRLPTFQRFFYAPTLISRQSKASEYTTDISGTSFQSIGAEYGKKLSKIFSLSVSGNYASGKVYNDLSFRDWNLESLVINENSYFHSFPFRLSFGLFVQSLSLYKLKNQSSPTSGLTENHKLYPGAKIIISKDYFILNSIQEAGFSYSFSTFKGPGIFLRHYFSNLWWQHKPFLGLEYTIWSLDESENKWENSQLSFQFGLSKLF